MANNSVSSLLNIDFPKPKTSNFNLGRVNRFSADVGWVIPCYLEEVLPNSYKRLDVESLIQTNATVAPLMGSFKVKIDAFFVPTRLYYRHLDLNTVSQNFTDDFNYHFISIPYSQSSYVGNAIQVDLDNRSNSYLVGSFGTEYGGSDVYHYNSHYIASESADARSVNQCLIVPPSSLIDYLGILPVDFNNMCFRSSRALRADPFIAYFDIWRNFYSNPHDPLVPMRISNRTYIATETALTSSNEDVYIPLDRFDSFVNTFTTSSYPLGLNAIKIFNQHITRSRPSFITENESFLMNVPLFSGQSVSVSSITGSTSSMNAVPIADTRNGMHFGLLRCTYMDDYFNSRFRNEFVSYMEQQSRVQVQNNEFTISQLRLQNRIAKYVDKSVFSDTRFGSWIKAHFGVKTSQKLNIPQFLGSISSNIVFNDIHSLAQTGNGGITSNQALGSRASLGQGYIRNKGSFIEFRATEPGFIMCMFRIIPYVSYFQGIKKFYLKSKFYDMYRPEFDAVGYDDLQKVEMCAITQYQNNFVGRVAVGDAQPNLCDYNTSLGKHPAYMEYMTSFDESHGLFTQKYQYGFWTLNRPINDKAYNGLPNTNDSYVTTLSTLNTSTYITPEYYNNIFAVDKYTDNFQVQIRFYDKTKQPISKQILPHL